MLWAESTIVLKYSSGGAARQCGALFRTFREKMLTTSEGVLNSGSPIAPAIVEEKSQGLLQTVPSKGFSSPDTNVCELVDTIESKAQTLQHFTTESITATTSERILESGMSSCSSEQGRTNTDAEGPTEQKSNGESTSSKRLKVEAPRSVTGEGPIQHSHVAAAWEHWRRLGSPKLIVAPMVDQSELPFRLLCRKYGATAAYTPMFHSRLFAQDPKYRREFTTCPGDRPLFVQFCANNPDTLLEAGRLVQDQCDYVDINFGCPQRIAKRGNYGAFLMDDLPLVRSLVSKLASNLAVPVSCKIRMFPKLEDTLAYAHMLEEAGCSLLAVHGRTRDHKNSKAVLADWDVIRSVKAALSIPVLANGNIRWLEDVHDCLAATGADGVLSAESLLENPALFAGHRMCSPILDVGIEERASLDTLGEGVSITQDPEMSQGVRKGPDFTLNQPALVLEYLDLCEKYPVPSRMIRAHVHRMLGPWFTRHPDFREELNKQFKISLDWLKDMVHRMTARHTASLLPLALQAVENPSSTGEPCGREEASRSELSDLVPVELHR